MTHPTQNVHWFGQGEQEVLALHCTLSHGGAWRLLAEHLSKTATFQAPDLPGHGQSGDWDGVSDLHDLMTDAVAPLLTRPVMLIGHSFGATVALRLAIEYPQLVERLCLIEPVLFAAAQDVDPPLLSAYRASAEPFLAALEDQDAETAARLFNQIWGSGVPWDLLPPRIQTYIKERIYLVRGQEGVLNEDTAGLLKAPRLAQVAMPVLLIEGDQSPPIINTIHRALAARLPQARQEVVQGAGHMLPLTHPKEVADQLKTFLEVA